MTFSTVAFYSIILVLRLSLHFFTTALYCVSIVLSIHSMTVCNLYVRCLEPSPPTMTAPPVVNPGNQTEQLTLLLDLMNHFMPHITYCCCDDFSFENQTMTPPSVGKITAIFPSLPGSLSPLLSSTIHLPLSRSPPSSHPH